MMKTLEQVKEYLCDNGHENAIVLENPDFCQAFIGTTPDGQAVYDFDKMVESLCQEDGMEDEEAIEFIEYNTIRALPYMGPMAPVIMHPVHD